VSGAQTTWRSPSPFSPRTALGLVGLGAALFVLLLWLIGAGVAHGPLNDGGAHGAGKGLSGYSGLAQLMEKQGWEVATARTEGELKAPGLVILTPPAGAEGKDLDRIVAARRYIGPTLVITPKWEQTPLDKLPVKVPGAKAGWVTLEGTRPPDWKGFLDDVSVSIAPLRRGWKADGTAGTLPDPGHVLSGRGDHLVPLAEGRENGEILAAFVADGGHYPALNRIAADHGDPGDADSELYPLVVVFEPDLLDNYGFARAEQALYALRLMDAAADGGPRRVTFDLSFNGFARSPNLLTLAFTPPFLAATLCLLIAALIVGWRAFRRFGPAQAEAPQIAVGKTQLVRNAGAILRRSRRFYLLGAPYAALVRERVARGLALPRLADAAATEAAIDRALTARHTTARRTTGDDRAAPTFSAAAQALRAARHPAELLTAAQALAALERMLKR